MLYKKAFNVVLTLLKIEVSDFNYTGDSLCIYI